MKETEETKINKREGERKMKNFKGITLIALVVTIVVLLILAGVSIGMLAGENGIIRQAIEAKDETLIGGEKEAITNAYNGVLIKNEGGSVNSIDLQKQLEEDGYNAIVTDSGNDTLNVLFNNTNNTYNINNGTITMVEPLVAGLYDINRNQIASWDDLINIYGLDVTKSYNATSRGYKKQATSLYYILENKSELEDGRILVVDNSVDTIGTYALTTSKLTSIQLPSNLQNIGKYTFAESTNLTNVTIPNSVISIGSSAFLDCTSLTNVTIPKSVISIESSAFSGCSNLTNINIPESVKNIGDSAFTRCENLSQITIPDSVINIGTYAFSHCSNLKSIIIPNNIKTIEEGTFSHCYSLVDIRIPNSVEYLGAGNGYGSGAFSYCINLKNLKLPDNLKFIGRHAFQGCTGLENIVIPDGVTTIQSFAFSECTGLSHIYIPNTVTSMIDDHNQYFPLFSSCNLEIYCGVDTIPEGWGTEWNNKVIYGTDYIEPKLGYTREQYEIETKN